MTLVQYNLFYRGFPMTLSRRYSLGLVVVGAVCIFVSAAQPPAKDKDKDPQSTFEPRSSAGAGQKFLEQFVGNWEVAKTFYPRSGDPVKQSGECRQAIIHDGKFLQSSFVFHQDDKQSTGLGLIGFESDSGKFTSVWTDSRATRMSFRQSEDKFNGEEILLYSRTLGAEGKDTRSSRTVTRLEDKGAKIVHRQYVPAGEGKERLVMELVMTRKTGKGATEK
jgi:hypothetical protein